MCLQLDSKHCLQCAQQSSSIVFASAHNFLKYYLTEINTIPICSLQGEKKSLQAAINHIVPLLRGHKISISTQFQSSYCLRIGSTCEAGEKKRFLHNRLSAPRDRRTWFLEKSRDESFYPGGKPSYWEHSLPKYTQILAPPIRASGKTPLRGIELFSASGCNS